MGIRTKDRTTLCTNRDGAEPETRSFQKTGSLQDSITVGRCPAVGGVSDLRSAGCQPVACICRQAACTTQGHFPDASRTANTKAVHVKRRVDVSCPTSGGLRSHSAAVPHFVRPAVILEVASDGLC